MAKLQNKLGYKLTYSFKFITSLLCYVAGTPTHFSYASIRCNGRLPAAANKFAYYIRLIIVATYYFLQPTLLLIYYLTPMLCCRYANTHLPFFDTLNGGLPIAAKKILIFNFHFILQFLRQ